MSTATVQPTTAPVSGLVRATLLQKLGGYVNTQLIYLLAQFGVADLLVNGPKSSAHLASALGMAHDPLHRLLRGCVAGGLLTEVAADCFAATALTQLLETDRPDSLRDYAILTGELWYPAWGEILAVFQNGSTPFETVFGSDYYTYFSQKPALNTRFHAFMQARTIQSAQALTEVYDFSKASLVIDIGGGNGTLLQQVLAANPHLQGILYDQPAVVAQARQLPAFQQLSQRCQCIGGDFLQQVPAGGDCYILSQVLHNWRDEECGQILHNCREAIQKQGSLLVLEQVIQPKIRDNAAAVEMDLMMMVLLKGRERTLDEYKNLLEEAGFTLIKQEQTKRFGLTLVEAKVANH